MLRQFKSLSNDISSSWKNIEYTCKMINTYLLVLMLNQPKMKILMDQKHKLNYMLLTVEVRKTKKQMCPKFGLQMAESIFFSATCHSSEKTGGVAISILH